MLAVAYLDHRCLKTLVFHFMLALDQFRIMGIGLKTECLPLGVYVIR